MAGTRDQVPFMSLSVLVAEYHYHEKRSLHRCEKCKPRTFPAPPWKTEVKRCMAVGTYGDQFSMSYQKLIMVSEIDGDFGFCC